MEVAIENVPEFGGNVHVAIDVSGSMSSSITGSRTGATSKVRCVDVASLFASAILRKNKAANLMPFDAKVYSASLNPRDTVLTNSQKLAKYGGGSTNCALVLETLCTNNVPGDLVIYISDSESWVDSSGYFGNGTGMLAAWKIYKKKNPAAKLVCIDLTPKSNSQVKEHKDILQVGGFGDQVFDVIKSFVEQSDDVDHWTKVIDNIEIK
jgi:60 kDa SS-A/Ro ribonucleoprotein